MIAERITAVQVCPFCNGRHTHHTGNIGSRPVWRCSKCLRTFWPKEKSGAVLGTLKRLLLGSAG